jgi:anti-anti-sigma factor
MFDISITDDGVVHLKGRLDAAQIEKAGNVLNHLNRSFTVDFADLEYISSAGLSVFLVARQRMEGTDHRIRMINMNRDIRDIFRYAGMNQIFDIE